MKVHLSFEQEAIIADGPDAPEGADPSGFHTGYVTVADGELYDGPGATAPPGNVIAYIGPIPDKHGEEAVRQTAALLRKLGHEVSVCGGEYSVWFLTPLAWRQSPGGVGTQTFCRKVIEKLQKDRQGHAIFGLQLRLGDVVVEQWQ